MQAVRDDTVDHLEGEAGRGKRPRRFREEIDSRWPGTHWTYPLGPGRFIKVEYPQNLRKQEIDRFIKVMQTLEEQPQIPMHTGEAQAA
jgi:hypothetical protein